MKDDLLKKGYTEKQLDVSRPVLNEILAKEISKQSKGSPRPRSPPRPAHVHVPVQAPIIPPVYNPKGEELKSEDFDSDEELIDLFNRKLLLDLPNVPYSTIEEKLYDINKKIHQLSLKLRKIINKKDLTICQSNFDTLRKIFDEYGENYTELKRAGDKYLSYIESYSLKM